MSKYIVEVAPNSKEVIKILEINQPIFWQIVLISDGFYKIFMQIPTPSSKKGKL